MAKRPHERKTSEPNGRGKWQKNASGSKSASGSVTQQNQFKALPGSVTFRVLCHSSKFGSIIGKGGGIVASIRQETGAKIRIEDIVQGCEDRVVVITGSEKEVEVSKEPNKEDSKEASAVADGDINEENEGSNDNDEEKVESSALEASKSEKPLSPVQNALLRVYGRLVEGEKEDDTVDDEGRKFAPFSVRLLIYPSQVGRLRGKGGSVIKQMSSDSGAQIRVLSKDQIPLCASPMDEVVQFPGDRIFPAQDALLRVHERIVMADNKESMVSTRLIVSSAQIGCLLGKGGSIITDMRKLTGAQIRIMGKDTPRSVAENDELVQVAGEFRTVQDALVQITTRLRDHLFRDINVPSMNHTAHPFDQMPQFGPFVGRREPSPTRMYPNLPPQFQNESTGRPHEERPFPTPGAHFERMPPGPWAPQGMREGGGTMPMPDFSGAASQRRIGGFPGGNQPTITVDVVVPRALVPSIYGEDGFCLKRIREISEAKITITEPRPEATETVILISGIPEQTHAAQSLLQAFVLSESVAG